MLPPAKDSHKTKSVHAAGAMNEFSIDPFLVASLRNPKDKLLLYRLEKDFQSFMASEYKFYLFAAREELSFPYSTHISVELYSRLHSIFILPTSHQSVLKDYYL